MWMKSECALLNIPACIQYFLTLIIVLNCNAWIPLLYEWWELLNKKYYPYSWVKNSLKTFILWIWLNLVMSNELFLPNRSLRMSWTSEIWAIFMLINFTVLLAIIPIHRRQIVSGGKTQRRTQEEHRGSRNIKQQNTVVQNSKTLNRNRL